MDLEKKRADLQARLEQLIGQVNRTSGAIALLDDLIAEQEQVAAEPIGGIDRAPSPFWKNGASASPDWVQGAVIEMPQVQS